MRRIAGLGCRADVSLAALQEVLARVAGDGTVDALATLIGREAALRPLAEANGLPLILIMPDAIAGMATPTRSPRVLALFATGCVAEAVALAALGAGAGIATPRQMSTDGSATAAIAMRETP